MLLLYCASISESRSRKWSPVVGCRWWWWWWSRTGQANEWQRAPSLYWTRSKAGSSAGRVREGDRVDDGTDDKLIRGWGVGVLCVDSDCVDVEARWLSRRWWCNEGLVGGWMDVIKATRSGRGWSGRGEKRERREKLRGTVWVSCGRWWEQRVPCFVGDFTMASMDRKGRLVIFLMRAVTP